MPKSLIFPQGSITVKAGDVRPPLRAQLSDVDGIYVIPAGATVSVAITDAETSILKTPFSSKTLCTIESAQNGIVRYDWDGGERANPGSYLLEYIVDLPSGAGERSFPANGYISLRVIPNLT